MSALYRQICFFNFFTTGYEHIHSHSARSPTNLNLSTSFKLLRFKEEAQNAPTPITNYALFHDGEYVTNEQMNDKKFIGAKDSLTVEEATEYSNIGVNRIRDLCKDPVTKFSFKVGKKVLIKREAFDEYLRGVQLL